MISYHNDMTKFLLRCKKRVLLNDKNTIPIYIQKGAFVHTKKIDCINNKCPI